MLHYLRMSEILASNSKESRLSPWRRALLNKLIVTQLVKKFSAFSRTEPITVPYARGSQNL
jgi:hypothetical protein